jgi:hypothetical protein
MQDKDHFGIIVSKQMSINQTLKRVLVLLAKLSAEDMKNRLIFLSANIS